MHIRHLQDIGWGTRSGSGTFHLISRSHFLITPNISTSSSRLYATSHLGLVKSHTISVTCVFAALISVMVHAPTIRRVVHGRRRAAAQNSFIQIFCTHCFMILSFLSPIYHGTQVTPQWALWRLLYCHFLCTEVYQEHRTVSRSLQLYTFNLTEEESTA
jgi:hypothetical protein